MGKLQAWLLGRESESSKVLLVRRHEHLIMPLRNDYASRRRAFANSTITIFFLSTCLFAGYAYAKLQQDEALRRKFYNRYANLITLFDTWSPRFEQLLVACSETFINFDSTYLMWYLKSSKRAEYRAYRKLEGEIAEKQAEEGDELSRAILALEKQMKA